LPKSSNDSRQFEAEVLSSMPEGVPSRMLAKEQKHKHWGKMLDIIDVKQIYGARLVTKSEPDNIPRLPPGYTSWLDYALVCIDLRSLELASLFNGDPTFDRDVVRLAARQELDNLRNKVATLDKLLAGSPTKPTPL